MGENAIGNLIIKGSLAKKIKNAPIPEQYQNKST